MARRRGNLSRNGRSGPVRPGARPKPAPPRPASRILRVRRGSWRLDRQRCGQGAPGRARALLDCLGRAGPSRRARHRPPVPAGRRTRAEPSAGKGGAPHRAGRAALPARSPRGSEPAHTARRRPAGRGSHGRGYHRRGEPGPAGPLPRAVPGRPEGQLRLPDRGVVRAAASRARADAGPPRRRPRQGGAEPAGSARDQRGRLGADGRGRGGEPSHRPPRADLPEGRGRPAAAAPVADEADRRGRGGPASRSRCPGRSASAGP